MSKIEWTERTWNPTTGCTKVSAGCKHCYAEGMHNRLNAMQKRGYERPFNQINQHDYRLDIPLKRKPPTVYFVNSMSDLFHPDITFAFIDLVMETIQQARQHTFQILTKRPGRMKLYFAKRRVPANAWLGTSVENRRHGVPRIDQLRHIQAFTRFLSCEPLLENLGTIDLTGIHWVIVGGESGKGARQMNASWVERIRLQCQRDGAQFFFKQWGAIGADGMRRNKKENGRIYNGRIWDAMPPQTIQATI